MLSQIIPFATLLVMPFWGALADKHLSQRTTVALCTLVCGTALRCCLGVLPSFLPLSSSDIASPLTFWVTACVMVLAELVACPFLSIVDASVLALLGESGRSLYGRQRLWGAVGWGIGAPLAGRIMAVLGTRAAFIWHALVMLLAGVALSRLPQAQPLASDPSQLQPPKQSSIHAVLTVLRAPGVAAFLTVSSTIVSWRRFTFLLLATAKSACAQRLMLLQA